MAKSKAGNIGKQVVVSGKPTGSNWARVAQGELVEKTVNPDGSFNVTLRGARQALYFDAKSGGEFGLAVHGPLGDCRITGMVASASLSGMTLEMLCGEAARLAWAKAPIFGGG